MSDIRNKALPAGTVLRGAVYTYTIEKVLGQGSFGITYLASTLIKGPLGDLSMPVAVKEFFAKDLDSRGEGGTVSARTEDGVAYRYAKAFQRESQNLSKMKHPGIVKVLEAFQTNGTYYYSMEYLPGGSLDDKVKGGGIPEAEALPMIKKIGEALAFMHGRKMMHLDLKPKNIMLKADGTPVIIDFGLSKQYDDNGEPESSSTIGLGTPGYAPLEQANRNSGKLFQSTLDIYALGATLYKMLTGVTPPDASSILDDGLPEIELKSKGVSDTTISAIRNAMSPGRKNRTPSVEDFLSMLAGKSVGPEDKTEDETEPKPAPKPTPKPTPKPSPAPGPAPTPPGRKPKTWLWALLGGLAALAVAAAFIFGGKSRNQGAGGNSGADTLAVVPVDSIVETPVAPPVDEPVPEAPGSIKITSEPVGAAIWLDGKNTKKQTPEILEDVTPGKHSVRLVLDGYTEYKGDVTVLSGGRVDLSRTLSSRENSTPAPVTVTNSTKGTINGHEWVDLGLSVKWATCNVGASSPEEYGSYFAWGEIRPKSDYNFETYRFRVSGDSIDNVTFSKYNTRSDLGTVDNKTILDLSDDAAFTNWGGSWRMPTDAEWSELCTECTWTWTTQDGKNGNKVTSKTNGNSIFLPAAGYRDGSDLCDAGSGGCFWSSVLYSNSPYCAQPWIFNESEAYLYVDKGWGDRGNGFSVRPVSE